MITMPGVTKSPARFETGESGMNQKWIVAVSVFAAPACAALAWSIGLMSGVTQLWQTMLFAWPLSIAALWLLFSLLLRVPPDSRPNEQPWNTISKIFHWVMALSILGTTSLMYVIVNFADFDNPAVRAEYGYWLRHHKSIGLIVLFLVGFRLAWNLWRRRPSLPAEMPSVQQRAAKGVHGVIYLGMLAVPLLGWSASMTYGGRTHFFGLFELPVLLPKNIEWANILQPAHIWAASTLLALVGLHVVAALWHHFVRKDATLVQMLPRITRGAGAPHARGD